MSKHTKYVAGFLFSPDFKDVVLIRKKKPAWQAGYLNAVGGKIEELETPLDAQIREFREETGVQINDWKLFCKISGNDYSVDFFYAVSEQYIDVSTTTDEVIRIANVDYILGSSATVIYNLKWLIPLAIDKAIKYSGEIVTCVNAMEGLSNEQVEGMRELIFDMKNMLASLENKIKRLTLSEHRKLSELHTKSQQYFIKTKTLDELIDGLPRNGYYPRYVHEVNLHSCMTEYAAQESEKKAVAFTEWKGEYISKDIDGLYCITEDVTNARFTINSLYQYWIEKVYNK